MIYHIYTDIIWESFKKSTECPLCYVKSVIEEQFLHEFLNDAVMDDDVRKKVNKVGFCSEHFDKLFNRKNKLSLALQVSTRLDTLIDSIERQSFKKQAEVITHEENSCIICDLVKESMDKYYKTVAYMFKTDKTFAKTLYESNGFCLGHYKELIKNADHAGFLKKEYLNVLKELELKSLLSLKGDLKQFCDKHDYRNANKPLGKAEKALPSAREKFYGLKDL